jgi:methyltransferase (TIGR00027 family)
MRSRYAEDCLAESLAHGVRQYVIMGAGLDTFGYRQPSWATSLRIFEVDHPATQRWKRAKLSAAGIQIPKNVILALVNFEEVSFEEGLLASGLDLGSELLLVARGCAVSDRRCDRSDAEVCPLSHLQAGARLGKNAALLLHRPVPPLRYR